MKFSPVFALLLASVAGVQAQSINGLWDATVKFDDFSVPFPIEFSQNGADVAASFFNGDKRITSTSGRLNGNTLTINFEHYGTQLKATVGEGELKGSYGGTRNGFHDFEAKPHRNVTQANVKAPSIGGVWYLTNQNVKREHAWRLIVKQKGPDVSASIVRVDGETGGLVGGYQGGKFVLNHFDGESASFLELTPKPDGTLAVRFKSPNHPELRLVAIPLPDAVKGGLPQSANPDNHAPVSEIMRPSRQASHE